MNESVVMWITRRLYVLLLSMVMMSLLLFNAGCEKISGSTKNQKMEIGKKAPDFVLQDASGKI